MSFLKEQLGEDELRMLLERLDAFNDDTKLDVKQLMKLADSGTTPELVQKMADRPVLGAPPIEPEAEPERKAA